MTEAQRLEAEGIIGLGRGYVDTESADFKALQTAILEHSQKQSPKDKLRNELLRLRFKMEEYNSKTLPQNPVEAGEFIKEFLKLLDIQSKVFAQYIGYQESNLSALYKGRRKINHDLALKLGKIFNTTPDLWLSIQTKNELWKIQQADKEQYEKYSLKDLVAFKEKMMAAR